MHFTKLNPYKPKVILTFSNLQPKTLVSNNGIGRDSWMNRRPFYLHQEELKIVPSFPSVPYPTQLQGELQIHKDVFRSTYSLRKFYVPMFFLNLPNLRLHLNYSNYSKLPTYLLQKHDSDVYLINLKNLPLH